MSRTIEEELIKQKVPYILYSGTAFYRRKEIKDILCYFRMITSGDDLAFLRVINEPKRGIGKKRMEFLKDYAETYQCTLYDALKENLDHSLFTQQAVGEFVDMIDRFQQIFHTMTITDLLMEVLRKTGYEERLRTSGEEERFNNLAELKQAIYDYETTSGEETTLVDYLDHIALFTNIDKDEKKQSVKLMTIHTAKGLEFPIVFVVALNEGIFPSVKTDTKEKMEEERRLAYVAITRAKERLFLSDAEGIHYDGSFRYPSRFIFNCEKVNLDYVVELPERFVTIAKRMIEESEQKLDGVERLQVGGEVVHRVFGTGEIIEVLEEESCYVVKFEGIKTTRNISFTVGNEI
ncbi:MAG: ATP-dependent helicase [Eubacteriales bacterium]